MGDGGWEGNCLGVLVLAINLLACRNVCDDQPDTWWGCDRSAILICVREPNMTVFHIHTLSPNPHMRARLGC